ncbi:MAG: RluA family pseudouridine synthase [Planctomycetota bacterium]
MSEYIVIPADRAGIALDEFLCLLYPECGKAWVRRQIRNGGVLVDGERASPSQRLREAEVLVLEFDDEDAPDPPAAPAVEIPILYEDGDLLVIDKPAGLAVEPERWAKDRGCLVGALLELFRTRAGAEAGDRPALDARPRIVHRIDKGTSGAVLVAKDVAAERALRRCFDTGTIHKRYLALVEGEHPLPAGETALLDLPLGPDERRSGRQRVQPEGGKPARTRVRVERRFRGYTLLACEPLTGRTHQIRVHLAAAGFPLAVDPQYGRRDALHLSRLKADYRPKRGRPERPLIDRLTLHAARIDVPEIAGDGSGVRAVVEAPLPRDFANTLKQLEKNRSWPT